MDIFAPLFYGWKVRYGTLLGKQPRQGVPSVFVRESACPGPFGAIKSADSSASPTALSLDFDYNPSIARVQLEYSYMGARVFLEYSYVADRQAFPLSAFSVLYIEMAA